MPKTEAAAPKDDGGRAATRTFQIGVGIFAALMVASLVLTLFPDKPPTIQANDSAGLQKLLTSGAPHFALCANDASNSFISGIFSTARAHLKGEGVEAVVVDCDGPTKSGKSLRERYGLGRNQPTWFFTADGSRPKVLPPSFSSGSKLFDEIVTRYLKREVKIKALTNSIDLNNCLTEKAGGCLVAYSARDPKQIDLELKSLASSHRSITFARLPAGQLALRSKEGVDDGFQALLKDAIKVAKENAQGTGQRGELLLFLKRGVSSSSPTEVLITVGQLRMTGKITSKDVDALVADHKAGLAIVKAANGEGETTGGSSGDVADRLLSRDEDLAAKSSVLVQKDAFYIGRVAPPKPKQEAKQAGDASSATPGLSAEQEARRAARQKARDKQRDEAASSGSKTASAGGDEDDERTDGDVPVPPPVDPAELERQRREAMEREAADSGFVAHLADDDGEEAEQEDRAAPAEAAEEAFDLDAASTHDDEL